MEVFDLLLLVGALGGSAAWLTGAFVGPTKAFAAAREEAATRLGLAPMKGLFARGGVAGDVDGHRVELGLGLERGRPVLTACPAIRVFGVPRDVFLVPYEVAQLNASDELSTGDGAFDLLVATRGPELRIRAALDDEIRALFVESAPQLWVRDGRIQCLLPGGAPADRIVALTHTLVAFAKRLARPDPELLHGLGTVATTDASARVRRACVESVPSDAELPEVFRRGLNDEDAKVRLAIAERLGASATSTLEAMVKDPEVPATEKAEAIVAVLPHLEHRARVRLLEEIDPTLLPIPSLATYCEAIGAYGLTELADRVAPHVDSRRYVVRRAATEAAPKVGDKSWEPQLVARLTEGEFDEIVVDACLALAAFGSVDAVEPLREMSRGLLKSREVRRTAEAAIEAIQRRAVDATPGGLSVVEGDGGAVSLTNEGGELSLDD